MAEICHGNVDPRVRRTRLLLQQALGKLLETKEFDQISVQDIAEAATVNRATFYDHYPDKSALLECMVGTRFGELLEARGIQFDGGCVSALRGMVLGVCDYLASMPWAECGKRLQTAPNLESAVIAVVRRMILDGVKSTLRRARVSGDSRGYFELGDLWGGERMGEHAWAKLVGGDCGDGDGSGRPNLRCGVRGDSDHLTDQPGIELSVEHLCDDDAGGVGVKWLK